MRNQALFLFFAISSMVAQADTTATATTPKFRLSVKHDGVRASAARPLLSSMPNSTMSPNINQQKTNKTRKNNK